MIHRAVVATAFLAAFVLQDPAPEAVVKAVSGGVAIMTGKAEGKQIVATGVVIHRTSGRALVLTTIRLASQAEPGSLEAVFDASGAAPRRVPARVVVTQADAGLAIVALEADGLPAPLKLDPTLDPAKKEALVFVGASSASTLGHARIEMAGRHISEGGTPRGTLPSVALDRSWDGSVAMNLDGLVIGFVHVPAGKDPSILLIGSMKEYLGGMPMGGAWVEKEIKPGEIRGSFRCHVVGEGAKVKSASLVLTRQDLIQRAAVQDAGGTWTGAVGSPQETFSLSIKEGEVTGEYTVKFSLPEDTAFVGQVRYERDSGIAYGPPEIYKAPFSKTKGGPKKDDDWIGGKGVPGKGAGVESGTPLARPKRSVEDVTIIDLDVSMLQGVPTRSACLSEDGAYLYVVGAPNLLRKIRTSDFVEERQLILPIESGLSFMGLALTRAGLVFLGGTPVELIVIDSGSLTIRRKVFIAEGRGRDPRQKGPTTGLAYVNPLGMIASPSSSRVFVAVDRDGGQGQMELVVDVGGGKIARDFVVRDNAEKAWDAAKRHPDAPANAPFHLGKGTITPDGRYLVANSLGALQKYRISGADLVLEETGPILGPDLNSSPVSISSDGLYATVAAPKGHRPARDHPLLQNVMYIYRVANLQKPWAVLRLPKEGFSGADLELAFDRESRQLYVADSKNLFVFDFMGRMTRKVALFNSNAAPAQVLIHPDGLKLAVVTRAAVQWIELPPPK